MKQRIKTNIVELHKLYVPICDEWLNRFVDGKIDAHQAFILYEPQYSWLYQYSPYDLIGWEIENNCFDWENNSHELVINTPEYFNPLLFNWKKASWAIAEFRPELYDPKLYYSKGDTDDIASFRPELIDPELYNWEDDWWAVEEFCPNKLSLMPEKYKNYNEA